MKTRKNTLDEYVIKEQKFIVKNNMQIVIPTKGRAGKITTPELFSKKQEITLVVEQQEFKEYFNVYGKSCNVVSMPTKNNDKGIGNTRNWVLDNFSDYEYIAMLDDDIKEFRVREGQTEGGHPKIVKIDVGQTDGMLKELVEYGRDKKLPPSNWLWGKEKGDWKYNTRVWCLNMISPFFCKEYGVNYDSNLLLFEDYDITAQILKKGFMNGCCYKYTYVPCDGGSGGSDGGCQFYRNEEKSKKAAEYLIKKWGDKIKLDTDNKRGLTEVQFNWKEIYNKRNQQELF